MASRSGELALPGTLTILLLAASTTCAQNQAPLNGPLSAALDGATFGSGANPMALPEAEPFGPTCEDLRLPDFPPSLAGPDGPRVWGLIGLEGYAFGQRVAPNGLEFNPLFTLGVDLNVWLWQSQGLYLFTESNFWGQRAAPGVTNASQGVFDFSKREFDFTSGVAWNYFGNLEARVFAYSNNNLNRGYFLAYPSGFIDGTAMENRLYLGSAYAALGTASFDVARAPFVSAGYFPTKDLVDGLGVPFSPGPFVRAYLTWDPTGGPWYVYLDAQFVGDRAFTPRLVNFDGGLAWRPWAAVNGLELRLGTPNMYDLRAKDLETGLYGAVRLVF